MTKPEILENLEWEDFTIQSQYPNSYMLILICKDKNNALSLMEFLNANLPTVRVSMNLKTLEYSIHFFFTDTSESLEYATGKTEKTYPPLKWLGSGLLQYITAGYMATPQQVSAFQPISLNSAAHPN